jgi:N-acetylglucosaminyldiphosphoundecaprenol N-acetyl-beta-D-mannosaminyltransferase
VKGDVDDATIPQLPPRLTDLAAACFVGDLESATTAMVARAAERAGGYVCHCNVHVLTEALHDDEVRRVLSGAAIRFPDGAPVAWLLRRVGSNQAERIGGPDLFPRVVARGREQGLRHFLVGSTERTLTALDAALRRSIPGSELVGHYSPPFTERPAVDEAAELIRAAQVHLVWVGLGAPKQEIWCARASAELPDVTFVGVGAAFDFLAGVKRRAPAWMRRTSLEWLFRMASEPRRLTSRYLRTNTEFVLRAGDELVRRR